MSETIFLSAPDVTELEEQALVRAFHTGWIAPLGPEVDAFERELCDYTGRSHCVVLSSGTAALHLGLLTLGVGPGDLVVTSSMTFAATANAIAYTGASPVFIDSDETGNMNPNLLAEALAQLVKEGTPAKALVPVDLLGKVADHERIGALAAEYGIPVLSDAAESVGATYKGKSAASYGVAAGISFNGNKIMTTSGGGAYLTDDKASADHVRYLATQARQPVVHYEHTDIGFNYRMSNLLAAMGRTQLGRLPEMMERRHNLRIAYREMFADVPGVTIFGEPSTVDDGATHDNWWLTSIVIDPEVAGFSAEDLFLALKAKDIESRPLWKPMHLQPVFADSRLFVDGTSERFFQSGLSLPSGSVLTDDQQEAIRRQIHRFVGGLR